MKKIVNFISNHKIIATLIITILVIGLIIGILSLPVEIVALGALLIIPITLLIIFIYTIIDHFF